MPLFSLLQLTFFPIDGVLAEGFGLGLLLGLFKLFLIVGGSLYVFFAFIVIRQIAIMRKTLITSFSPLFTVLGYAHFIVALLALLFFFTAL